LAGIEPPARLTLELPTASVRLPPQPLLPVLEMVTPGGNVSVNDAPVAAAESVLLKVIVSVEGDPAAMVAGLNALLNVGRTVAGAVTVKLATAGAVLLPLLLCSAPARIELM
jgi:hypothetical protein